MSSGPKNVTSTTNTEPPAYLVPSLQQAANAARGEFNALSGGAGVPQFIPPGGGRFGGGFGSSQFRGGLEPDFGFENPVFGGGPAPATRTGTGLDALFTRGQEGSPLVGSAGDLTQQTLAGDFLSPDTNPYLEATFNRAADLTRGRLDTEFAGAGRNLGASRPARSDELQTLAANIFGQNFQAERGRQMQAVDQAQSLAGADFRDIQAMIDAGTFPLDQFINRLAGIIPGAGGVTQATQPFFRTGLF